MTPQLAVIRDQNANPTDRMTWAGFDADGWNHRFCGTVPQPWPEYRRYESLEELDGYDLYDVADLMYPWAQAAVERWPGRVIATIWENIPFNHWSPAAARMLVATRGFIPRSQTAAACLDTYGVGSERIHIIPAAVDTRLFCSGGGRHLSGERRVLYVGRLTWEKGICDLAYASRGQEWRIALAGDGPLGDWARATFGEATLGDEWPMGVLGWVDHDTVLPALMRAADVVVLPSQPVPGWMEQFGVVVIEAMASGTPVVTTDTGAFREIIPAIHMTYRHDHGFLPMVPAGRWDLLANTVTLLLQDEQLWNACSGRYEWEAMMRFGHAPVGKMLRDVYGRYL